MSNTLEYLRGILVNCRITVAAVTMSGLGEGVYGSALPVIPIAPPLVLPPPVVHKAPMAHNVLDRKTEVMDMHIDNMLRRHRARANPDITPDILDQFVNGEVQTRAMAIARVFWNAADRMLDWDLDRRKEYNRNPHERSYSFRGKVKALKSMSYRYMVLYQMLSSTYEPPDRAVVEYINTSADEM